jgi:hypothetical protein
MQNLLRSRFLESQSGTGEKDSQQASKMPLDPHALPTVTRVHFLPNRKLHQVIDLVTPDETTKGEALELHNEHIW